MKKYSGQLTIEAAIILPIVMMIIVCFIYVSLYVHDIITIKSYAYSYGIEYVNNEEKDLKKDINKIPTFVLKTKNKITDSNGKIYVEIFYEKRKTKSWLNRAVNMSNIEKNIKVEKKISEEIMYASRAVCDELEK